ncbi:MAG: TIGR01177 family methyltransferase [Candidatus Methanomethylicota archaeon]|uniref:tRNA (guanine(10)-N(2))-dimethyltransferase n=1 Tax=Thermoproteota archaeon TaxID=2056631 RepID=A0A497EQZ0_9CREN|nr:MAG: TIGR01177 family methyltransferase [Candidatus Verstraetearchaeota archaeon]
MTRLAFLLSGEHPEIPFAEVKAILEAEGLQYKVVKLLDQFLIIETSREALNIVAKRASMCMNCGELLFESLADWNEITKCAENVDWSFLSGKTFVVRVKRVKLSCLELSTLELEKKLGAYVVKAIGAKVNLRTPDVTLQGVLTDNSFVFYVLSHVIDRGSFDKRRPRTRPFFHPGVLSPRISRVFINLARAKSGEVLLDPFCGTGGFLIEAGLIGCEIIGLDVDFEMVKGAKKNLAFYGLKPLALIHGDARKMPFTSVRCIATDPPYGRAASSKGVKVEKLYSDFLAEVSDVVEGYVCLAYPHWVDIEERANSCGLKLVEEYSMYVHKSLTRRIAVLKRA